MWSSKRLIRFDWAMKRLLRNKANFGILEGFLSELLKTDLTIVEILDSESNKDHEKDKYNRVDILVKDDQGELIIVEVQNDKEYDYFQRMLYGVSKAIVEHMYEGWSYAKVKRVIAVNVVYFDLGQGEDYLYHGSTSFEGMHKKDTLGLSQHQIETFKVELVKDVFPEYYIIKVNNFDDNARDTLDEWVYFFKNSAIKSNFSAKGIKEAARKLDIMKLPEKDQLAYKRYLSDLRDEASKAFTIRIDTDILIKEAEDKVRAETETRVRAETETKVRAETETKIRTQMVIALAKLNISTQDIMQATQHSEAEIQEIIKNNK